MYSTHNIIFKNKVIIISFNEIFLCIDNSRLNIEYVYNIAYVRNFALVEIKNEFLKHFRNNRQNLPLLTSECLGWICYAEKTQEEYIIPYINHVRSPQQILASLIKKDSTVNIYHISIRPCYDKKLKHQEKIFSMKNDNNIMLVVLYPLVNLINGRWKNNLILNLLPS